MANGNLRVVSTNDMPRHKLGAGSSEHAAYVADSLVGPPPEEALRLMHAFTRISDRRQRARLIEQAEKIADL